MEWLRHFVEMTRPTAEKQVLLVLDNHESHKYLEALEYATQNHVIFTSLVPHTTHKMQPLDTCVYGPFKNYFEQEVSLFQRTHVGRIISHYDVAKLFGEAYMKAANAQNAVKGFSTTGIWLTNRNVFNDSDYMPSTVTDRSETTDDPDVNEQRQTVDVTNASNANIMEVERRQSNDSNRTMSPCLLENWVGRFNSKTPGPTVDDQEIQTPKPTEDDQQVVQYSMGNVTPDKQHNKNEDILHSTPLDIRPIPKIVPNKTSRKKSTKSRNTY